MLLDLGLNQDGASPSSDVFEDKQNPPAARYMDPTGSPHADPVEIPTGRLVDTSSSSSDSTHSFLEQSAGMDLLVDYEDDTKPSGHPQITRKPSNWAKVSSHKDLKECLQRMQLQEQVMREKIRRESPTADQPLLVSENTLRILSFLKTDLWQ